MVRNYMEILVENYLADILKNDERYVGMCTCQFCMDDIMAKALNNLPPFYITCKKGEIYGEYHVRAVQNKTDILSAIVSAVEFVALHSHHEV